MARQKPDVTKRTLALGGARICAAAAIRRNRTSAKCKGIKPDKSADRPGNSGRAGHRGFIGRRADADAAATRRRRRRRRGRHEVATDRTCENLRRLWRRFQEYSRHRCVHQNRRRRDGRRRSLNFLMSRSRLAGFWLLPPLVLSKFRAFCLKLNLATAPISLTYPSSPTAAPCQALVARSPVALPPVSAE